MTPCALPDQVVLPGPVSMRVLTGHNLAEASMDAVCSG